MPILHRCKELVLVLSTPHQKTTTKKQVTAVLFTSEITTEIFTCIRIWCQFFTDVKNCYHFFAPPQKKQQQQQTTKKQQQQQQVTAVLFTSEIITEFFTCIRNWCQFFTGVRNQYQLFAPPPKKNKTKHKKQQATAVLFTSEIITEIFTCVRIWCQFFTGVRNWYQIFAPPKSQKTTGHSCSFHVRYYHWILPLY